MIDPQQPINLKPGNGDTTKQFALKVAIVGIFIVVVGGCTLYGNALYTGRTTIPENVSTAISVGVVALIGSAVFTANLWVQSRQARSGREDAAMRDALLREATAREAERSREEAVRQAEINRAHSDQNAQATQVKVEKLIADVNNGLPDKIKEGTAALVKDDNEKAAALLIVTKATTDAAAETQRVRDEVAANSRAIAAMLSKLDAVLSAQQTVAPQLVLPNGQAVPDPALQTVVESIAESTAETAANTRDEPEGSAV